MSRPSAADPDTRFQTWPLLLRTHKTLVEILERSLSASGGPPLSWYDVLIQLELAGGRLTMKELAGSVLLSKSGITRLVDRMTDAGLVQREICETDKRMVYAALTKAGRRVLHRALPGHVDAVKRSYSNHLTDTEARAISEAFRRILERAEGAI